MLASTQALAPVKYRKQPTDVSVSTISGQFSWKLLRICSRSIDIMRLFPINALP
jgi:hypothetical protein